MSADKSGKGSRKGKGKGGKAKPEAPAPEVVAVEPVAPAVDEPVEAAVEPVREVVEPIEEPVASMTPSVDSGARETAGQFAAIPEEPDPPSYAPILTGLGIAVFAWGFLTAPFIILVGMLVFATGMTIWIKELTHEP